MRDPEFFTVHSHRGERNDPKNGQVDVGILYRGLKNTPSDIMTIPAHEARILATRLLVAAAQAEEIRL